jgi:hypothetical protein
VGRRPGAAAEQGVEGDGRPEWVREGGEAVDDEELVWVEAEVAGGLREDLEVGVAGCLEEGY